MHTKTVNEDRDSSIPQKGYVWRATIAFEPDLSPYDQLLEAQEEANV